MTATVIDGTEIAAAVCARVAAEVAMLPMTPGLATVLVGDDPASATDVRRQRDQCVAAGMRDLHHHLPGDISQDRLNTVIEGLNANPAVTGILVRLPLPAHLRAAAVIALIDPDKDVAGLTTVNAGRLARGAPGLRPCTPSGVIELLDAYDVPLAGTDVVVVGRSDLVGRPQALLLMHRDATVTICHSRTRDLATTCRRADVLIVAAGIPHLIGPDAVKPAATVIDVGMHRTDAGLCGDVDFAAVREIAGAITPVPGGVGPMTTAMLLRNTLIAARNLAYR